ncbi:MAG: DUF1294 domain-containing protein [Bacillota bacterium]|nr:DUF1294 domain-containing protein [Bacillota bacterium]
MLSIGLKIFIVVYILWNSFVFVLVGSDKRRAKTHRWRIPEARLLLMGASLGGVGLYAGMRFFHHKTAHAKFTFGVPILILINLFMMGYLYSLLR